MNYYVYIVQSLADQSFYKGFSEDPLKRLQQHNNGDSPYSSGKVPWKLVYVEEMPDKRTALMRERSLKKQTAARIEAIISSEKNIVSRFYPAEG